MSLDIVKRKIQNFFDQGTLTIVGSGLSCAEGISSMRELSDKLLCDVPKLLGSNDTKQWERVKKDLQSNLDLESVLQKNKVSKDIEKAILNITYDLIASKDECVFKEILEGERNLKFSQYLSQFNTELYDLTVITTNYDLLIEYACENNGISYTDSFFGKIIAQYSPEYAEREMIKGIQGRRPPKNVYKKHIKIYKPHGSINWKLINNKLCRINHINYGMPCIITPGSNKYEKGYEIPFDYHIGKMGEEIDKAKRIVYIGYGFNDNHLETHLNKLNNIDKPKLIITRTLYENAKNVVKNHPNTIALEVNKQNGLDYGTKIHMGKQVQIINDKKLWDLADLIMEVF